MSQTHVFALKTLAASVLVSLSVTAYAQVPAVPPPNGVPGPVGPAGPAGPAPRPDAAAPKPFAEIIKDA